MEFVHLHVHSEFSLLSGALRIPDLVDRANRLGMPAVALTDGGNMFGAVALHRAATECGIAPILGCEINLVRGSRKDANSRMSHHLVLLAASQTGYENLVRVVSEGWVSGLHRGVPRIDLEILQQNRQGLVGLTGCMGGYLAQSVMLQGPEAGRATLGTLRDCFEPGHLFVELQDHGFPENGPLNEVLIDLARHVDIPLVATNDCHFAEQDAARAQLVLQCIGASRSLSEMQASHHNSAAMYLKSGEEMAEIFRDVPEAIRNTLRVAEMCGGQANPLCEPKLPSFAVPAGLTEESYLRRLSQEGLETRFAELTALGHQVDREAYRARLNVELNVIVSMGFSGYFLIVQDFINWAKRNGVPVGPGRGSGAGSICAWALRITDLDPIQYGLLFERFLNPERVSMPDFDVDFCMDKRDVVINYVRQRYGRESVGQIATFHQLKSRSVVRDVGRVLGMAASDAGRIATLIPEPVQGRSVPIATALTQEPRLKASYDEDAQVRELIETAQKLENLTRHAGMHAAGVVISEGPIWDHVPVFCPEDGMYVTQYHKDDVEAAGLVKFDFLGLKTLTVLDIAVQLVNKRPDRAEEFRLETIPVDDKATFALLQSGETTNVFQLESSGMQSLFKQLRPDCFEDIIAAVALYRPGPLGSGMVEDFVQRKHGRVAVEYPHPCLEAILKDTYGVIVYQEQVMQIAQDMAGYTLGGADLLRRAMGKKKESEMAKQKAIFVDGAKQRGHSQADAERVFELMAYFAGYGFNKSHSAAYALLTYQTAYLKSHYPVEFQCATLSADKEKSDKVVRTVAEARSMGITVLPPDVNESEIDFTVVYEEESAEQRKRPKNRPLCHKGKLRDPLLPKIRFGLGAIKGVGESALEAIFESRHPSPTEHQPFVDLFDFGSRVDLRRVNRGVFEALVQCGAFDSVHGAMNVSRARAYAAIESSIERGKKLAAERQSGQTSLLGLLGESQEEADRFAHPGGEFPRVEEWDLRAQLAREKTTLGFYVSGHPLAAYKKELARFCDSSIEGLHQRNEGEKVTVGGMVEGYRERNTKVGKMAFFWLEDPSGRIEVKVFARGLEKPLTREVLGSGEPVALAGTIRRERDRNQPDGEGQSEMKLVLDEVTMLTESISKKARHVRVRIPVASADEGRLRALREVLTAHPGACPVTLELAEAGDWSVTMKTMGLLVDPSEALLSGLERLFGHKVCELR